MPTIDLWADLNAEDDEGRNWSMLRHANNPAIVKPGAMLIAGIDRVWAVVRIEQVDDDGQVHFVQLADDDPDATDVLARQGQALDW
jgi:hypothetical protein